MKWKQCAIIFFFFGCRSIQYLHSPKFQSDHFAKHDINQNNKLEWFGRYDSLNKLGADQITLFYPLTYVGKMYILDEDFEEQSDPPIPDSLYVPTHRSISSMFAYSFFAWVPDTLGSRLDYNDTITSAPSGRNYPTRKLTVSEQTVSKKFGKRLGEFPTERFTKIFQLDAPEDSILFSLAQSGSLTSGKSFRNQVFHSFDSNISINELKKLKISIDQNPIKTFDINYFTWLSKLVNQVNTPYYGFITLTQINSIRAASRNSRFNCILLSLYVFQKSDNKIVKYNSIPLYPNSYLRYLKLSLNREKANQKDVAVYSKLVNLLLKKSFEY